ncbi:ABC transporter permease [Protaetiibacter mangrovi]|uniref:Iron ABC transporter permease n=1 Tax=Protaetiibacter mangrovi TaxID=2970926 RepID=A0ABT1ZGJ6_9MICO|nr:iron ABC transporter permease [Protaetiibacter mangrovi]MCS0499823.1 iron ABC transporter permease [Protaetiibacter mangrovi]TPX02959.1 iron ABC transporter permease [Schumannella luteola]
MLQQRYTEERSAGQLVRRVLSPKNVIVFLAILIIGYLVLTPAIYLFIATFFSGGAFTLDAFRRAYGTSGLDSMVLSSIVFTVGATVLALALGTALAYITVRTNVPFRSLIVATSLVPLIVPGLLYTIAWVMVASPNVGIANQIGNALTGGPWFDIFSMPGMIWVEGTHNVPLVYLFMFVAFRAMDPSLEESALVNGATRATMLRRITIPLMRPALAAAALVVGVKTLGSFEVPTLLGVPGGIFVFVSRIYYVMSDFPYDTAAAGALSIGLVVLAILGTWALNRMQGDGKQYATVTGKGFRPAALDLGRWKWPVAIGVLVYFLVTTALPLFVMAYNSLLPHFQAISIRAMSEFTLQNYVDLFENPIFARSVGNSLLLAVGTATAIMVLTAVAAWVVVRGRRRSRKLVDQLTFIPMVFPGLVIGLAVSFVYLRNPLPIAVYGTLLILLIAYMTNFLPYGMRYAMSSLQQISAELEESSAVAGASWWQTWTRIVLPLMFPGLMAGWIYLLIVAVRELGSSILLYSPGNEVIAVLIFQMYEEGELVDISALGVVLVVFLSLIVALVHKFGSRVGIRL